MGFGDLKIPLLLRNFRVRGAGLKLLRVTLSDLLFHICIGCIWRRCNYSVKLDLIVDIFVLQSSFRLVPYPLLSFLGPHMVKLRDRAHLPPDFVSCLHVCIFIFTGKQGFTLCLDVTYLKGYATHHVFTFFTCKILF